MLSRVRLFAVPWTVAYQAPLSMEFSRQAYWSGLSFPSPGDLPDPGIEPRSPALQADALPSEPPAAAAAAAAKSLQSCSTLCDPIDGSPPGSAIPGIFQQEHWSGLPFPSPMRECESEVAQLCPTLSDPMDCSLPGSSVHGIFQARVLELGAIAFSESLF